MHCKKVCPLKLAETPHLPTPATAWYAVRSSIPVYLLAAIYIFAFSVAIFLGVGVLCASTVM